MISVALNSIMLTMLSISILPLMLKTNSFGPMAQVMVQEIFGTLLMMILLSGILI
jgi:hypothetical protein